MDQFCAGGLEALQQALSIDNSTPSAILRLVTKKGVPYHGCYEQSNHHQVSK